MRCLSITLLALAIGCAGKPSSSPSASDSSAGNAGGNKGGGTKEARGAKEAAKPSADQSAEAMKVSQNNLKQMAIGLFTVQDTYTMMVLGPFDKKGPNYSLSWRVAILPHMGEAELYKQFHLDEAWDSEHNKKLIEKMPKVYQPVNGVHAEKGHTFYRMFNLWGKDPAPRVPTSFPDGPATTILIVEAGEAVPWTKPEFLPYDEKKPLPILGGHFNGDFNILTADGKIHFISKEIPEKELRALITPAGKDKVTWDLDKKK